MLYNNTARAFISGEQPLNLVLVKLHPHSLHLYLCIPLILPFLTYLLLLHFLHSVFIFLFSLLLAIFILASYLSYGNTPLFRCLSIILHPAFTGGNSCGHAYHLQISGSAFMVDFK
ncbi:hypothetical protein Bandiella_00719 [Candidatus Bandiella woodruffii]|uniref:Uncharacterized protein n=1 Tax=Candidatus Bandiella euplotis TaxID=1664265 RepID=A0ABZ0UM63_9RICK|nr:hypothetical protein Bandiella_00719 [Candidatus Bandiella woodruffii]